MDNKPPAKQRVQRINGVSYVYEDYPFWNPQKKQMRHKREYIGKLDAAGQLVPNKAHAARMQIEKLVDQKSQAKGEAPAGRCYYGATYLLDAIGEKTGVTADLKACFPLDYQRILSLVYYLVLEDESPMYRFAKWARDHRHPWGGQLPSQRISELFASIGEEPKMVFFKRQIRRRLETEYLVYDTTSISSYSELINYVRYGNNKDGEPLPQINLALIFGQISGLPVYYRKLPGNIPDVKTVRKLVKDIDFMDIKKVKLVMDRGFCSAENINELYRNHYKFVMATKISTGFASSILGKVRETVKDFTNYDLGQDIYCTTGMEKWPYREYDGKGNVTREAERRIYVHVYYNGQRAENEKRDFARKLTLAEQELLSGTPPREKNTFYERYFQIKKTPVRGIRISCNEEAIRDRMRNFGYFILLSNEIKDPLEALSLYRNKDLIEKSFGNLKNRLNMRRTSVSSDESLEGKLFVQFVALIYVSYIHRCMKENELYKKHTMQTLLDNLDIIERYDYPGQRFHCSEITQKQRALYACFGVSPPNML